jgi:hypothetical protein
MTETLPRYSAARIGYAFWAVVTPSGSAEHTLTGPDAEEKVRALVAERNAELDEDIADDTHFSLVDALLADVSCHVPGYTAGNAIETAEFLLERFTITRKPA